MHLDDLLQQVDKNQDELVAIEQALVRIPSVNTGVMPTGNETPVCEYIAAKLAANGIDSQTLESAPGRGNLVARMSGDGSMRLLFMAHTDVVPVENETEWTYPPFGGEVHDGRVWGRGSHDMKGMLASEMMAMLLLKRAGVTLGGSLILAACADEEAGGVYGAGWLAKTNPELILADVAVNEGGGTAARTPSGLAYFLTVGEKGRYEVHITIEGRSWHASQPWRADNPLFKTATVLQRIRDYQPPLDVSAPLFAHLQQLFRLPKAVTSANVDEMAALIAATDPSMGASLKSLSRMTLVPTLISGGVKSNSIAERIMLTCDIRSMPSQDTSDVQHEVERVLEGIPGVSFELVRTAVPSASRSDHPFAEAVRRATALAIGRDDFAWVPGLTAGFTDSRHVRPLGAVVYDFAAGDPDANAGLYGAHNKNESQDIASLVTQTRMLLALAWDVLAAH